jgi:2-polyprenyl-6-methoxyphenol hydroxylase-like FAD-dependent oxidoreductase
MGSLAPTPKIAIVGGGPSGLSLAALLESKGVTDYVVYERSGPEVIPRGACLDLHPGSGQKVFKDIGAFDEMKAVGRWGKATVHYFTNHLLERLFEFGDGRDAPEVDRYDIRRILLSHIPKEKVRFSSGVKASYRDDDGKIVLELATGEKASGFLVVVGADGAFSKIRHLVN